MYLRKCYHFYQYYDQEILSSSSSWPWSITLGDTVAMMNLSVLSSAGHLWSHTACCAVLLPLSSCPFSASSGFVGPAGYVLLTVLLHHKSTGGVVLAGVSCKLIQLVMACSQVKDDHLLSLC